MNNSSVSLRKPLALLGAGLSLFAANAAFAQTAAPTDDTVKLEKFGVTGSYIPFAGTATAVAFVGAIGFIGLVGPHIARLLVGEDHRYFLPASVLAGAVIMSLASAASKIIVPGVLMPVGIVTAVIGVPVFLLLIFRNGGRA